MNTFQTNMTKINGKVIEQSVEVADSERGLGSTASLRRMMDAGERYFWSQKGRGGVKSSWTLREEITASANDGNARKMAREESL